MLKVEIILGLAGEGLLSSVTNKVFCWVLKQPEGKYTESVSESFVYMPLGIYPSLGRAFFLWSTEAEWNNIVILGLDLHVNSVLSNCRILL